MNNMENQNPEPGTPQTSNRYLSAEEIIAKMKVAFTNAKEPEILAELATVGITESTLDGYLADVESLEQLSQNLILMWLKRLSF